MAIITQQKIGNGGRLGNILFTYASLIGIAGDKHTLRLPKWEHSKYFIGNYPESEQIQAPVIKERGFTYSPFYVPNTGGVSISGYLQSSKYWHGHEDKVRKALTFKPDFIEHVKQGYNFKNSIAIHVRRGDYVNHSEYHNLSPLYYIQALYEHFPNWKESNLIFFSDDIEYCRVHFGCLSNAQFSVGSEIEDLARMSLCDNFIIANSSFSWWGAYLANRGKVVRPIKHFAGTLERTHNIKDLYPESWIPFQESKINLKDCTFTIPVQYDHSDRRHNLDLSICILQHCFDTNIIVMENKHRYFEYVGKYAEYRHCDYLAFHRTKMLNEMAKEAKTDIVINWDADIIISPMQILQAVEAVRNGDDLVYPYDGTFARMPRTWFHLIQKNLDIGVVRNTNFNGISNKKRDSFGGAVIWNKKSFFSIGGENEKFISFGAEDLERYSRAVKLGLKVSRVNGILYHIDHFIGVNSSTRNPYFRINRAEYEKVNRMSKEELGQYVSQRNWKI